MESILGILWYNIFATNDAVEKLGGHPYDNSRRWYSGSRNDLLLNFKIRRFHADSVALSNMEKGFKTSGDLLGPVGYLAYNEPIRLFLTGMRLSTT